MQRTLIDLLKESGHWDETKQPELPPRPRFYWFFLFVGVLTAVTWLQMMAEFFSDFDFSSMPFELNNIYLFFLGAYAGTKELARPSDPAPLPEKDARLIKGEFFLVLWGLTAAFIYLKTRWYPAYHVPHDLPLILKGVLGIFVTGYGAKSYRLWLSGEKGSVVKRSLAEGPIAEPGAEPVSVKEQLAGQLIDLLWTSRDGFTRKQIEEESGIERWTLMRLLKELVNADRIVRLSKSARDKETRYTIPEYAKGKR